MSLFSGTSGFDTNLWFLHRGVIDPKSGIGGHFHNYCEEMFVIFDGEAQFTIDGRTSTLKGPAGAPTRMGHWHAIYNPTDQPVEWMNINVALNKNQYDAFDLGDGRVGAPLDPDSAVHDHEPGSGAAAGDGRRRTGSKGEVKYRRVLGPTVFLGPWGYLDQVFARARRGHGADDRPRSRRFLLRDLGPGQGDDQRRDGRHQGRRRDPDSAQRHEAVREHRRSSRCN